MALAELTAAEAMKIVRDRLDDASPDDVGAVFDALRALAWKKFAERIVGDEMREWYDVFRQTAALFEVLEAEVLAHKTAAFADLAAESIQFGRANALPDMQRRIHVREVLTSLRDRGGKALRSTIRDDTKLRESNLSRILAHMAAAGFVERRPQGRQVVVSLTSLGREVLTSPTQGPSGLVVFPPIYEPPADPTLRRSAN